ncbi:Sucrase/ferredoxin-like-domain-containing protein [Lactarius pseudohatsudake]|nr:Sucrase/ferredoxin-like-domain-containing protein [Lactarius pseudohatsudake]
MNRLRQLVAILLNTTDDLEQSHGALEAAGVPVSFADCRTCPNPCEDGHEEYPHRIASMIDRTSEMLGSVRPYRRQVVISTGRSDWKRSVTSEQGSLASYLAAIEGAAPTTLTGFSTPGTLPGTPNSTSLHLPNATLKHTVVSILNGSHDTLSKHYDHETVLIFPDYKVVAEVPRSLDWSPRPGSSSGSSAVKSWVIPYACVILICSHRRRDARCAVVAPKLEYAFSETLEREGWDVHTQLDDPTGPPLEDFADGYEKEAELNRRLQELDNGLSKRALVLKTSHIGGHKYAGNVIIYMPQGAGVWYGRVSTHEVEPIVRTTILGGQILPPLLRGGVNLARPDCKRLNDW